MPNDPRGTLERIARRVPVPEPAYDRLLRRKRRKDRNRGLAAAGLALVVTVLSVAALLRAFGGSSQPAREPTPATTGRDIFSGLGGWIAYGNRQGEVNFQPRGIWAMDPERPGVRVRLSTRTGEPLAWSADGSELLILRWRGSDSSLHVLHANGSDTLVTDVGASDSFTGASLSPDGSKVVFASLLSNSLRHAGLYEVDATGGVPEGSCMGHVASAHRRIPPTGRRSPTSTGRAITTTRSG